MMKLKHFLKFVINGTPIVIQTMRDTYLKVNDHTIFSGDVVYDGSLGNMPLPLYVCIKDLHVKKVSLVKKKDDETFAIKFEL